MKNLILNRFFTRMVLTGLILAWSMKGFGQKTKPNVLVILADDLGYSDLGCYGSEISTPHLDALAKEGFQSQRFYNSARCCPSRAALLTGRHPHEAGMGGMVPTGGKQNPPGPYQGYLNRDIPTLAEIFKNAGYQTLMTGKWHVGEERPDWPCQRGFDRYFGLISGASSYYEVLPNRRMLRQNETWTPPEGFYATDAYADTLVSWLGQTRKSFFAYLAFTAPHWPLHAPEADIARCRSRYRLGWDSLRTLRAARQKALGLLPEDFVLPEEADAPKWVDVRDKEAEAEKMAVYAAMVERMDAAIGRVVRQLKASRKYDNTLIVFLSDNGGCAETIRKRALYDGLDTSQVARLPPGPRGSYQAYGRNWARLSNTPFRLFKSTIHEGGIASPLICKPATPKPAGNPFEGGFITDLFPVFLKEASLTAPATWNGKLQTPLPDPAEGYGWEHEGNRGYRKGNWKLVALKDKDWELYDLLKDPSEKVDLANDQTEKRKEMEALWAAWAQKVGAKSE